MADMKESVLGVLSHHSVLGTRRMLLLLAAAGIGGAAALATSYAMDLQRKPELILRYGGLFVLIAAVVLATIVLRKAARRRRVLQLLRARPEGLQRIHFELYQRGSRGSRRFLVQLHIASATGYYLLPEADFMQVQDYFLAHYPAITPTTLKRKLEKKP